MLDLEADKNYYSGDKGKDLSGTLLSLHFKAGVQCSGLFSEII